MVLPWSRDLKRCSITEVMQEHELGLDLLHLYLYLYLMLVGACLPPGPRPAPCRLGLKL